MSQLELKYKKWKKDIAYLKDIDAFDFKESSLVSILMDFVPDEVHKEVTMKHETVGKKSSTLKELQLEVEKIMAREKDRSESRKDRKSRPVASVEKTITFGDHNHNQDHNQDNGDEIYIWDGTANFVYGGFIAAVVGSSSIGMAVK